MRIQSLEFLLFTAGTFCAYYLFPRRSRWWILLVASLIFFLLSDRAGLIYLFAVAAITYSSALAIAAFRGGPKEGRGKKLLILTLISLFGLLVAVKFGDTLWTGLGKMLGRSVQAPGLLQPLGLSWFTFQSAGYVIDVYRGKVKPEGNFGKYLLFVSFFPQLTQGPISAYDQLAPQLYQGHALEPVDVTMGFQLMLWGFFKKLVLADRLAPVTAWLLSVESPPGYMVLLCAVVFLIRLYGDFSGGMDIIRGAALTLGIGMTENFRRPLFALSVGDYWRRWHISLGNWFRNYLLYPFTTSSMARKLGKKSVALFGKRIGQRMPTVLATVFVFLLIGIWHGAYWNAVLYGVYFGLLQGGAILLEGWFRKQKKRFHLRDSHPLLNGFRLVRTWGLLLIAQFFAFTNSPGQAFSLMGASLTNWNRGSPGNCMTEIMAAAEWWIALAAGMVLLTVDICCDRGIEVNRRLAQGSALVRWLLLLLLIAAIVLLGCYGEGVGVAAFVYAQF